MKQIIKSVLDCYTNKQINLGSEAARESIASEISEALIENGTYTKDSEMDKQMAREKEKWVCTICGKNTYNVDYDYIGSGTNHLGCELKIEMADKGLIKNELKIEMADKDILKKQILEIEKELYKGEG